MGDDPTGVYDRLGAGYDRVAALLTATGVPCMRADPLATVRGEVLDIAAGTGIDLRHYPQDVRVTGVDLSAEALPVAGTKATELGVVRTGPAVIRAITPLTVRALGCHPDRRAVVTVEESGFATRIVARALRGVFVAVVATAH